MIKNNNEGQNSNSPAIQNDRIVSYVENINDLATSVNQLTDNLNTTLDLVQNVAGMYAQCKQIEAKSEAFKEWSKAEITKTIAKYKSCQEFMYKAFGERDRALSKHYELLDKAVNSDDKELILAALQGISGIVTKSPLADLEQFARLYEDTTQTLLDF